MTMVMMREVQQLSHQCVADGVLVLTEASRAEMSQCHWPVVIVPSRVVWPN